MPGAVAEPELLDAGWRVSGHGAFRELVGPFYVRERDGKLEYCFRVQPKHDNTEGRAHGGMIMSFCDEALGMAAVRARPGVRLVTISFDCQFIGGATEGSLVVLEPQVIKTTASLVFLRGLCLTNGQTVAACSGVWKAIGKAIERTTR